VAAALVHGQVGMAQFEDDARSDRHVRDLMEAVEVVVDEDLDAAYPSQRPARVVVGAGGREYVEEVMQPYGEPGNPMSDDAIDAKFHRLVEPVLGRTHTTVLAEAAWALDDAPALFAALRR
jgi:2-methylcitrate dehydratase PrpD